MENWLFLCGLLCCVQPLYSDMIALTLLSRHGNRSPNNNALDFCPKNYPNYHSYDVAPSQLTGKGMRQLYGLGLRTKTDYSAFIGPTYYEGTHFFRGCSASRCLNSAQAMVMALWQSQAGPTGFLGTRPTLTPIHSAQTDALDTLLAPICTNRQKQDQGMWLDVQGRKLVEQYQPLLDTIQAACGIKWNFSNPNNILSAIKTTADMLDFDHGAKFPLLTGVSEQNRQDLHQLSFSLLAGSYTATPEAIVYNSGDFPLMLMNHWKNPSAYPKVQSLHGHRELIYMLASFFNTTTFRVRGYPVGAVPTATTLFWELYQNPDGSKYVAWYWWNTQCEFAATPELCEKEALGVGIDGCTGNKCPLDVLVDYIEGVYRSVGTFLQLCHNAFEYQETVIPEDVLALMREMYS